MLGFTERKSVLIPTQKTELDSRNMTIPVSEKKAEHLILKN